MYNKITFINFGKFKSKNLEKIFLDYVNRISNYAKVEVKDLKINYDTPNYFNKIKDKILDLLKDKNILLLTEEGKNLDNIKLSDFINIGYEELCIIVGSSWGIPKYIKDLKSLKLSIGNLTLPHEMVRAIIAEQIYRSFTIIKGEKYHK